MNTFFAVDVTPMYKDTGRALLHIFISQWRKSPSFYFTVHLPGHNQERQSFLFFCPGSLQLVALLEHLGFGSHWIIVISISLSLSLFLSLSLSLSLSPHPDMKGTSFVICIFTPECIFQVGIEILWALSSPSTVVSWSTSVCLFIFTLL